MHKEDNILIVDEKNACKRLDVFIADNLTGISRSLAQKLIKDNLVFINQEVKEKKYTVNENDIVLIKNFENKKKSPCPKDIKLDIVYEDEDIIVVNKPKGMVVHPGAGNETDTLVNALLNYCGVDNLSNINDDELRPGIIHRLDKDTSGILVVAKNNTAHSKIAEQIKEKKVYKEYRAIVNGKLKETKFTMDYTIGRHKVNRKKMCVCDGGRQAVTHVELIQEFPQYSYVKVALETGRTHQIRVHFSYINKPVAGDTVYGAKKMCKQEQLLNGQCLHSKKIGFIHPGSGIWVEYECDLPKYFKEFIDFCSK